MKKLVYALVLALMNAVPIELGVKLCRMLPKGVVIGYLRRNGACVAPGANIMLPFTLHNYGHARRTAFANLIMEENAYIGRNAFLDLKDKITIESHACLAMNVTLITHTNAYMSPLRERVLPDSHAPVTIGRNAYVGANAVVLEGVTIGDDAVIGACSLVTRSIPSQVTAFGVPCRV